MNKTVVLDAGHGGKDGGACGNGLREKDIALKVANEIAKRLKAEYEGVECILTRSTDVFLELKERTDMANKTKADMLVSIHCNAGGGAGGFESFTYNGSTNAATAAFQNVLHGEIYSRLKGFGVNDRGQKRANLHMCRESKMPAVLIENLFIDVDSDANRLKRTEVLEAIINGHVVGIAKYLGLKTKQTEKPTDEVLNVFVDGVNVGQGDNLKGVTRGPVRALAQALGAQVIYDATNKRIDVISKK
ncbi:hypothetical protein BVG16_13850 [Paenibacillus selenitireducens]|uniref:MurNAc-LAA domain-containing protein n=1 Tax=Paenibacillus selenitireducens TaxID=1324314 RepID=A0A1T2XCG2_9BACL|nr:N-acetylmuramoyl-L-alanine amidase [Paenibacillus selenitireducens]OPA77530.1 hypothetical protein BVG16_13850 [Paenibacillus selenitireducens]